MPESFAVEIVCQAVDATIAQYEASLDLIASELFKLEGGGGSRFSADAASHRVTFAFVLIASDLQEAARKASNLARTALHAAGAATPGWDGAYKEVESRQKQLQMVG
jgi:hypothetical protein